MNEQETGDVITYANAIDARVQANLPTRDLWHRVLSGFENIQCQAAIQVFYERYSDPANRPVIDAPTIRRIIIQETDRSEARGHAIEAKPREPRHPLSYRARNPERWDILYQQGRTQGNAERQANTERRNAA
ncbi:hypothetical protein D6T65_05080 [Arthrobacter frigidicola]|nr:hypothetical protein D6T65_05080 [Arthrobacter frigidicola]